MRRHPDGVALTRVPLKILDRVVVLQRDLPVKERMSLRQHRHQLGPVKLETSAT
jgi:hypothetical protein